MAKANEDWSHTAPRHRPGGPKPVVVAGATCPLSGKTLRFGACSGCKYYLDIWYPWFEPGDTVLCNHPGQPGALAEFLARLDEPKQGSLF